MYCIIYTYYVIYTVHKILMSNLETMNESSLSVQTVYVFGVESLLPTGPGQGCTPA